MGPGTPHPRALLAGGMVPDAPTGLSPANSSRARGLVPSAPQVRMHPHLRLMAQHAGVHMQGGICRGAHALVHMHGCTCMGAHAWAGPARLLPPMEQAGAPSLYQQYYLVVLGRPMT